MRQSKNESTWFLMFHRCLALFVWMCVLWTGTFMHDISDLQFETKDAVAISHHGHHHGHSHAVIKRDTDGKSFQNTQSDNHDHSMSWAGSSATDVHHTDPVAICEPPCIDRVLAFNDIKPLALWQRPPPDRAGNTPIYLINRNILI